MEASKIIANRAYRIIKELTVNSPQKPQVGDIVYCYQAGAHLCFAFCHLDSAGVESDFLIKVPRHEAEGVMVFSKLLTLPPSLRRRYNIRDDGTRIQFKRSEIYVLTSPVDGAPAPETLYRCIQAGQKPMMIHWGAGASEPSAVAVPGLERQHLMPAPANAIDTTHDDFSMTCATAKVEWNWISWRIRMENEVLRWRGHELALTRTGDRDLRVDELTAGALNAITDELRAHLRESGIWLQVSNVALVELYANHEYHFKGLRPFSSTVDLIQRYVDEDRKRIEQSKAQRKAAAAALPASTGQGPRKRMSGAAYKNMLHSRARNKASFF